MTATMTAASSDAATHGVGRVVRVIGPVVDVEFAPDEMPDIYNALTIEIEVSSTSLMGQLVPAHTGEVFLSLHDGTGRRVPVDELGAFTIDPIPEDRFRLQVAGQPQVTTDWIVL